MVRLLTNPNPHCTLRASVILVVTTGLHAWAQPQWRDLKVHRLTIDTSEADPQAVEEFLAVLAAEDPLPFPYVPDYCEEPRCMDCRRLFLRPGVS